MNKQTLQYCVENGKVLKSPANHPLLLDDISKLYMVKSGYVDIFVMSKIKGKPEGRRTHVTRVEAGNLIFPVEYKGKDKQEKFALVDVGEPKTEIIELSADKILNYLIKKDPKSLIKTIDSWVIGLYSNIVKDSDQHVEACPTDNLSDITVEKGQEITFGSHVKWIELKDKKSHLLGLKKSIPKNCFLPVTRGVLVRFEDSARYKVLNTIEVVKKKDFIDHLDEFHHLIISCFKEKIKIEDKQIESRVEERLQHDSEVLDASLKEFLHVLNPDEKKFSWSSIDSEPLFAACEVVAKHLNIKAVLPKKSEDHPLTIEEIALESNFQTRAVHITGKWWKRDGGALLAFKSDTNMPCALIPTSSSSYDLVEPGKTAVPVNKEVAALIGEDGYMLYPPLPEDLSKKTDLLKFALTGMHADILRLIIVAIASGALGLLTPILTGYLFSTVIPEVDLGQFGMVILALFAGSLGLASFGLVEAFAMIRLGIKADIKVESAIFDRLSRLKVQFFKKYSVGDMATRVMAINSIHHSLTQLMPSVFGMIVALPSFFLLIYYSPVLAAISLVFIVGLLVANISFSLIQLRYETTYQEVHGQTSGVIFQIINGIAKIQGASAEVKAFKWWTKYFAKQKRTYYAAMFLHCIEGAFNAAVMPLMLISIYAVISYLIKDFPLGTFMAFNAALGQFMGAMLALAGVVNTSLSIIPTFKRGKVILDAPLESSTEKTDPGKLNGSIEVSNVSFKYDEDGPEILKDINLTINPGEFAAIVGHSGSGKSTLARLVLGFETPTKGSIYYDSKDLDSLNKRKVRQQIGVVFQNSSLMSDTIYKNIIGSSTTLTMDDAWYAADMAGLAEDIDKLPMGMQTLLSEGGGTLSGGQQQRLMIARALVRKPEFLLFDEATSALDNHTQNIVNKHIEELQITRIVIAHRLSTIVNADKIYVIDKGELVQQGSYDDLINQPGLFAELAKRQIA